MLSHLWLNSSATVGGILGMQGRNLEILPCGQDDDSSKNGMAVTVCQIDLPDRFTGSIYLNDLPAKVVPVFRLNHTGVAR